MCAHPGLRNMLPDRSVAGATLVHFSAQPEPILTQNAPSTPSNSPQDPPNTPKHSLRAPPIPHNALTLSRKVEECEPLLRGAVLLRPIRHW